jgi:hypothetical protein
MAGVYLYPSVNQSGKAEGGRPFFEFIAKRIQPSPINQPVYVLYL